MKKTNILLASAMLMLGLTMVGCGEDKATSNEQVEAPVPQKGGYNNINNATLEQMVKEGVTLIDIRRPEEWASTGVVEGSKKITFFLQSGALNQSFVPEFTSLVKPGDKVALICRTGSRTKAASQALVQQLGYKNVYNVKHGITGWIRQGRAVVK
ncbi:MAG: Rhodanese [uncultured Thiotrichaceae bacterium]|uniref:Rhodanese n=1 Tax=uncultured Thiotrichaceae bacterium TaxID=298394 RepID=A0A6S6UDS1_9GAMM|nr:MAG: Rhodanese [uncultured Thiotrichaceae bacterium]